MKFPTVGNHDAEILRKLEIFNETGDIKSAPLIGFDQNGKWIGIRKFSTRELYPAKITSKLSKIKVPKNILITTDAGGTHLHGTYQISGIPASKVEIEFSTICGNINVFAEEDPIIHAPNLTSVKGRIDIHTANVVDMPKLRYVLDTIDLGESKNANIPQLRYALQNLRCAYVKDFHAPELRSVGEELLLSFCSNVHVPKLTRVGNSILAFKATNISATKLKFVGGRIDTSSAPDFYSPNIEAFDWETHPDAKRQFAAKAMKQPPILID